LQLQQRAWAIGARDGATRVAEVALEHAHAFDDVVTRELA
jgi:hypothetical protein